MFTIRISHAKDVAGVETPRSVYQAHKYRVAPERVPMKDGAFVYKTFVLIDENGAHQIKRLLVEPDCSAFVMNEQGVTVDVIKGKP